MNQPPELQPDHLAASEYLRPVWRFKWMLLITVLVVTGGTYRYFDRQPKTYVAGTQVYVGASDLDQLLNGAGSSISERAIANQARLIASPRVARDVRRRLKLRVSPDVLLGTVDATPDASSDF